MTRFQQEYSGKLGEFWKKNAENEISKMVKRIENGEIEVTESGAAYWKNCGKYLPEDCAEILTYTGFEFNAEATSKARTEQNAKFIENYRKNHKSSAEERMEALNNLGPNAINIITGERV